MMQEMKKLIEELFEQLKNAGALPLIDKSADEICKRLTNLSITHKSDITCFFKREGGSD